MIASDGNAIPASVVVCVPQLMTNYLRRRSDMADLITYAQIADRWHLWQEYVDPGANMTEEEFDGMTIKARVEAITYMFGQEFYIAECRRCDRETTVDSPEMTWPQLECPACEESHSDWDVRSGN
jgi:hypothetical protein